MSKEWLSINGLSNLTGIPESTTRRYIRTFGRYLSSTNARGRFKRYAAASVGILEQISAWYKSGKEREEIEQLLRESQPITVEQVEDAAEEMALTASVSPASELTAVLARIAAALERLERQGELERRVERLEQTRGSLPWLARLTRKKPTDSNR